MKSINALIGWVLAGCGATGVCAKGKGISNEPAVFLLSRHVRRHPFCNDHRLQIRFCAEPSGPATITGRT